MSSDEKKALSRKEFLRAFAGLVVYATPAVVLLDQLGCSAGSGPIPGSDAGTGTDQNGQDCSYSGTSISCSSISISTPSPDAG